MQLTPQRLEWEPPKNVGEIRSFLGLAGYYRRFIENFSKIAKPMTQLLKKEKVYEWTEAYTLVVTPHYMHLMTKVLG